MENQTTLPFPLDIQFFAKEDDTDTEDGKGDSDQIDDSEIEDGAGEGGEKEEDPAAKDGNDGKSKTQSRAENAYYAQKRREAEKAAKEKAEKENQDELQRKAYNKGFIAAIGGLNPYTKEPIEDDYDLEVYQEMKKLDDAGENPKEGIFKALRAKRSEAKKAIEESKEREKQAVEVANQNMKALKDAHPECDAAWFKKQYEENQSFKSLLAHGYTPLEAYDFLGMKSEKEKPESQRNSTPSSTTDGNANHKKGVSQMSVEEVDALIKKLDGR